MENRNPNKIPRKQELHPRGHMSILLYPIRQGMASFASHSAQVFLSQKVWLAVTDQSLSKRVWMSSRILMPLQADMSSTYCFCSFLFRVLQGLLASPASLFFLVCTFRGVAVDFSVFCSACWDIIGCAWNVELTGIRIEHVLLRTLAGLAFRLLDAHLIFKPLG